LTAKITTCQLCRKYLVCENANYDPVFDEHGFDFPCFIQDYFTPEQLKERANVTWNDNAAVYAHFSKLDIDGEISEYWRPMSYIDARYELDVDLIICALQMGPPPPEWKPLELVSCEKCGEVIPVEFTDSCPNCGNFFKQPQMRCPKCGAIYDDFDGVGVLHCPACGYCIHPATKTIDGKETCCVCGREIME
jgi:hypothetical protein